MNPSPWMLPKLGVNIDHFATLRQLRGTPYPDLVDIANRAVQAGAHQITVHLREDRRHIQDQDVVDLRKNVRTSLNLEMAVAPEIIRIAHRVRPDWVCLVPEKRREVTTEGGLDVLRMKRSLGKVIEGFRKEDPGFAFHRARFPGGRDLGRPRGRRRGAAHGKVLQCNPEPFRQAERRHREGRAPTHPRSRGSRQESGAPCACGARFRRNQRTQGGGF